jgi:predicted extracellular nuclease
MKHRLVALALVGLAGQSMAGGLFFSEYCEGSSNNKYMEIYNATGATVDMTTVTVKTYANGAATPTYTFPCTGTLAAGDVYVIRNASANATIQAFSDAVSNITFYNGDDTVVLEVGGVAVDVFGVIGFDPGTSWTVGTDATGGLDNTCVRNANICDGLICADNATWIANGAPQWTVYPVDTFTYGGSHTANCSGGNVPPVVGTINYTPNPLTAGASVVFDAVITDGDGLVTTATLHYGTSSGNLNSSVSLIATGGGHFSNVGTVTAPAGCSSLYYQIEAMDDDGDVSTTGVFSAPVQCVLTISQIQGEGVTTDASPYAGVTVTTEGVVTFIQSATSMFIQDDHGAWNGIQVFGARPAGILQGDRVRVSGTVLEYQTFTEIAGTLNITVLESPASQVINSELATIADINGEAYESVLVSTGESECTDAVNFVIFDSTDQIKVYFPTFLPEEGACYLVTGVRYKYQTTLELLPRMVEEIVACPAVDAGDVVSSFSLGKAWPNPFNPTAEISFSLDRSAQARLAVHNVLGQEVAVLVDGVVAEGTHTARFDAAALPSGLYLYTLQSEGRQLSGRMLLVR